MKATLRITQKEIGNLLAKQLEAQGHKVKSVEFITKPAGQAGIWPDVTQKYEFEAVVTLADESYGESSGGEL
ncbi:MAG: hypothetical protein ACRBI6_04620 [Acidimicrobiales bacterium]